jgi:hypothetical protein
MSNLEMEIYAGGPELTLAWPDEQQYQLGKKFLIDLGALWFDRSDDRPDFVCLENTEQLKLLFAFQKSLTEKQQKQDDRDQ